MKCKEIIEAIINKTEVEIQGGMIVSASKKQDYVYLFGRYRKYKWWHKIILINPRQLREVSGIDTSRFNIGDKLYLNPQCPGGMTNKLQIK